MAAYCKVQEAEFAAEREHGYAAVKHQRYVGTGYFDEVAQVITGGKTETTALKGSTEEAQFENAGRAKPAVIRPVPRHAGMQAPAAD